jgi:hypothetical protein
MSQRVNYTVSITNPLASLGGCYFLRRNLERGRERWEREN